MARNNLQLASKLNFIWKNIARTLVTYCETCGTPRLYSVFDAYIAGERPHCASCASVYFAALPLIKIIFGRSNLELADVSPLLKNRLIRKSMLNVVRGITHFGVRKPQPTAVPVVVVWNYTNHCNLTCLHCHQNSVAEGGVQPAQERELTTEEKFKVIDVLSEAGVSILTFSGGEPLVRSDIFDAVKRASDAGLLCTIASNGLLMSRETVEKLKKAGIKRVEIGLDGCQAQTHDFLRNTPGSYKAAVQGIKTCVEAGFDEVCATMTLHAKNVNELHDILALAERLGVTRFYLNRLIPAGRGKSVIDLDVTKEQKIRALETIYEKFYNSALSGQGMQCYARGMTYYGRLGYEKSQGTVFTVSEALSGYSKMWVEQVGDSISQLVRGYAPWFGGCSAGITYAGLTAGGDLLPCVPAPITLGNVLHNDLEELWVTNDLLNYMRRRDELTGSCGACGYNTICGGCRYTAYAVNGDWLTGDPSCPFGPASDGSNF